jgi:UDP-N-acetylglucosamine 2-epimerase (non-hydrolysing)
MQVEQARTADNDVRTPSVLTLFGTRPEAIKLGPVINALEQSKGRLRTINVSSGQHTTLLEPFVRLFGIRVDHDLQVMEPGQNPNGVCARVLAALDALLSRSRPDMLLVQGDTTTAFAGALAAFHRGIPVGHVEAGLRSGNPLSPFPEEMNRRLVSQVASLHFAATARNRDTLVQEGIDPQRIIVTGNPVVDALQKILARAQASDVVDRVLTTTAGLKLIVLTTHRRESFGPYMTESLKLLYRFVESRPDIALAFPVHPNPVVVRTTRDILRPHPRVHLLDPLDYENFVLLLSRSWLIVSDSGGVQEEAPTLGKPLIVLRENTERPEAVECGVARLVGPRPDRLGLFLEEAIQSDSWIHHVARTANPFGRGDASDQIVDAVTRFLLPAGPAVTTIH